MLEEEYALDYFKSQGLIRKICTKCGSPFWTRTPDRTVCGDAPCEPYAFIGNPVFHPHSLDEMREAFLSFFERHGHTRIDRYPVAARWRDDIYLTIASIADFQPYVTSGVVPPPANPLTISQPCIRLNDLDSVGRSGRHLTLFEMMAHHAFNTQDNEVYWKDETVAFCDEFLRSIGADLSLVTYKEHPWIGGGNAGPSLEVLIGGLEVATLVFMNMTRQKNERSPTDLDGVPYYPMDLRIVDTGYGLERFVWASKGSPTIYDAIFPDMVSRLMKAADLEDYLKDVEFTRILSYNAKFAGIMGISTSNMQHLRKKVSESMGLPVARLEEMIVPIEKVYTIADHTRCLAYMLGDCIVPSNVREGYLARLVLRRTLRMMNDISLGEDLAGLIEYQMNAVGMDDFEQDISVIREIVDNEVEKYAKTLDRGGRIVQRLAKTYKKKKEEKIPAHELVTLYDSHGIPPEIVREVASGEGVSVELPDNFYSLIADLHSEAVADEVAEDPLAKCRERVAGLPATRMAYYDQPGDVEFEAIVLDSFDGYVVLDQTLFYPEGGGQPADTGTLVAADHMVSVDDTIRMGDVILHHVTGGSLNRGDQVKGVIDEERRRLLMQHHTATHLLLHSARTVLGAHIHQAGAQKGVESSRLDIRHYRHITSAELREIEVEANRLVTMNLPVSVRVEERTKAEQTYGFDLYQGGVPPGREIRVVKVAGDVQACAGTHCQSTGEVGAVKIIRVEHIQDGIERIEFAAGIAAVHYMEQVGELLSSAAAVLSVQPENLPGSVSRIFSEWKERGKEIERLRARLVALEMKEMEGEVIAGVNVVVRRVDAEPTDLVSLAGGIAGDGGVALLAGGDGRVNVVAASGTPVVDASEVVREVCSLLGGKGGGKPSLAQGAGKDASRLDAALAHGRELIGKRLHE